MTPTAYDSLIDLADRMWNAAWTLDEIRSDTAASEWTARQVRNLMRTGTADDPTEIARLANALERRLDREGVAA